MSARLVAPFKPKESDLYSIISAFEAQYSTWNDFQNQIERYWVLRWLQQQGITQMPVTLIKEDLVRFDLAPFVMRLPGIGEFERGQKLIIDLLSFNELELTIEARLRDVVTPNEEATSPSV